ncbi:MAG TPA: MoaD/ThiS family protein [Gemmatimonadales bacterium]|nr:MoaD/ThiS family protein [Gemmatimonadales bacterium]
MPNVTVRFFARYAELAGCDTTVVRLSGNSATVADVLARVRELIPGARDLPMRPFAALNMGQVQLDARVKDGDEVALLPPLSGG